MANKDLVNEQKLNAELGNCVDLSSSQTISGSKTISSNISFTDGTGISQIVNSIGTDTYGGFNVYRNGTNAFSVGGSDVRLRNKHLLPENNNATYSLGSQSAKWKDGYFSGTVYADNVEQVSPNWDAGDLHLIIAGSDFTLNNVYSKLEVINGVLYLVVNYAMENVSGVSKTTYVGASGYVDNIPTEIGSKIIDIDGKNLTQINDTDYLMVASNSAFHKVGTEGILSSIPLQNAIIGLVRRTGQNSLNSFDISTLFPQSVTIPAGEKVFFSGRLFLTLI